MPEATPAPEPAVRPLATTLRPHHGMCIRFFEGKGYSDSFVGHMVRTIAALTRDPQQMIEVRIAPDALCGACPKETVKSCIATQKATRYDTAVLDACGLKNGDRLPWQAFQKLVEDRILKAGKRSEICGDCEWDGVCDNKENQLRTGQPERTAPAGKAK